MSGTDSGRRFPATLLSLRAALIATCLAVASFALGRWSDRPPAPAAHLPHAESAGGDSSAGDTRTSAREEWVCPMHPHIRQDHPGRCPICHMELVLADSAVSDGSGAGFSLGPDALALARVRTSTAERVPLSRTVTLYGRLQAAESGEIEITARSEGRIEQLHINTVGQRVHRGDRLARIYSPEIAAAQETLLHALRQEREAEASGSETRRLAASATARSARVSLRRLGLGDSQIAEVEARGTAEDTVDIRAVGEGTVVARHVARGDWVMAGEPILTLRDFGSLQAVLQIHERELPLVSEGMSVQLDIPGSQAEPIVGSIDLVYPEIDEMGLYARARVPLRDAPGRLPAGLFVRATVTVDFPGTPLSVPASAVLWTGPRSLVYRWDEFTSPPSFIPTPVTLGPRVGDRWVIEDGIFEGEPVVTNGAFRVDSTAQIRGEPSMMAPEPTTEHGGAEREGGTPSGHPGGGHVH